MRLRYLKKDGEERDVELSDKPLTIGRSGDADVLVLDEKASRVHCGIRYSDGAFFIKDLKSKNGTYVNDKPVDLHQLRQGDRIRIGSTVFLFETEVPGGADTALQEMQGKIDDGAGYSTILREIVHETTPAKTEEAAPPAPEQEDAGELRPAPEDREPLSAPEAEEKAEAGAAPKPDPAPPTEMTGPSGKKFVVRKKAIKIKKIKRSSDD